MNDVPHSSFDSPESVNTLVSLAPSSDDREKKRLNYTFLRKSVEMVFLDVYDPFCLGI